MGVASNANPNVWFGIGLCGWAPFWNLGTGLSSRSHSHSFIFCVPEGRESGSGLVLFTWVYEELNSIVWFWLLIWDSDSRWKHEKWWSFVELKLTVKSRYEPIVNSRDEFIFIPFGPDSNVGVPYPMSHHDSWFMRNEAQKNQAEPRQGSGSPFRWRLYLFHKKRGS
jgi:hypothetical protein